MTKPIVLLGGSFDPVHLGHVVLARYFCDQFQTDQLRLIPAGNPWQKTLYTTPEHRINMLKLAFSNCALNLSIDLQELHRTGPSYTIDTLRKIRQEVGHQTPLILVLGFDQFRNLSSWYNWQDLFLLTHFAIGKRPTVSEKIPSFLYDVLTIAPAHALPQTPFGLTFIGENPQVSISATQIRSIAKQENFYHPLIPEAVLNYIKINQLYRN